MTEPIEPMRIGPRYAPDESEFGGAPGLIQPPPHELTVAEQAMVERWADPADPDDSPELARIRRGGRVV